MDESTSEIVDTFVKRQLKTDIMEGVLTGTFIAANGPQIWFTDGRILYRLDSHTETMRFNRRELRIIKALLEESLATVDEWFEDSADHGFDI